jgi:hypothetical protein
MVILFGDIYHIQSFGKVLLPHKLHKVVQEHRPSISLVVVLLHILNHHRKLKHHLP